jgi:multidrug resistance protein
MQSFSMAEVNGTRHSASDPEKADWIQRSVTPTPSHLGEFPQLLTTLSSQNENLEIKKGEDCKSIQDGSSVLEEDVNVIDFESPDDPANPQNFSSWLRWTLISLVSAITFVAGLSSSMFAPGVPDLLKEFKSDNQALGSLVVTIFVLGLATGPLFFAPLSELYGRSSVQHVGCIGFLIFTIACAVSKSLNMLIGMRLLQGTFASVPLTNGGGIIADMVRQEERGFAMAMFTLGTLFGPVIGPVAGGFVSTSLGWRWVFWIISILVGESSSFRNLY